MSKIRRSIDLQYFLEKDLAWRIQEISCLRREISDASELTRRTLLRASIPLLYAHWEGYVKNAAISYSKYLSRQGLKYEKVHDCFMGLSALEHVKSLASLSKKIFVSSELLAKLMALRTEKISIPLDSYITNVGNLDYNLFAQIVQFLGFSEVIYRSKQKLIDESLVNMRNMVAHGEYVDFDEAGFRGLSDEIVILMREFKTDIENAVSMRSYIK